MPINAIILTNMTKKTLILIIFTLFYVETAFAQTDKITIHPGIGVDNIKLGHSVRDLSNIFIKPLFVEELTGEQDSGETQFYSYKNAVLGIKINLTKKEQSRYKKLNITARANFLKDKGKVSEIKIIPLLGDIKIRGTVTSKSTLNDVLTAFGPLNFKLSEEGQRIKCFSSTIDPSPFNSNEHVMAIHYFNEGIKFEFLIAEKNMLTTVTVGKVSKCLIASQLETF